MSNLLSPIFARVSNGFRAFRAPKGSEQPPVTFPSALDFQGGGFGAHRCMQPAEVRWIIEQAAAGSLDAQWELFALMEDSWPRLAKNLNELRQAASRSTYSVQPYALRGEKPTDSAKERAALVDQAIRQWWPRPATLELSFENALYHALDAYGKGISVLELHWQSTPDGMLPRAAHVLAPRLYTYNADGSELGLRTSDGKGWVPFADDHFLVGIWHARTGAPGATAVLRALAPYWCGITFGWEWLMSNAQIFGVPFRWATYDRNTPNLGPVVRDMLASMGTCGYGAFPDGAKLEFKEAATNVTGNPQVVVQELANKECDLLILGQELSGGAKAAGLGSGAAGLQGSVRADRLHAASQWCADLLNYQLVPAVLRANWGDTDEAPTIVPDTIEESDPVKLAARDQVILGAGVALPRKWFYERHGIPEPLDNEPTIGGSSSTGAPPVGSGGSGPGSTGFQPVSSESKDQHGQDARATPAADKKPIAAKSSAAITAGTDALYNARALALLTDAQRTALAPLLNALAIVEHADDALMPAALRAFQAALDEHAPTILANPALAAAWEKVIAPAAVEGVADAKKP